MHCTMMVSTSRLLEYARRITHALHNDGEYQSGPTVGSQDQGRKVLRDKTGQWGRGVNIFKEGYPLPYLKERWVDNQWLLVLSLSTTYCERPHLL